MTAREFVDGYRPSMMAYAKGMEYKPKDVAKRIIETSPDIRYEKEYGETQDVYIDETMSCDVDEVLRWMIQIGKEAIRYGIDTKNLDWKIKFIVAWDIAHRLKKSDWEWVS